MFWCVCFDVLDLVCKEEFLWGIWLIVWGWYVLEVEGLFGEGVVVMIDGIEGGVGGGVGEVECLMIVFLVCWVDLDDFVIGFFLCMGVGCFGMFFLVDFLLVLGVVFLMVLVLLSWDDWWGVGVEGEGEDFLGVKYLIWVLEIWLVVLFFVFDGVGDGWYFVNS